jgi:hypothetical protein
MPFSLQEQNLSRTFFRKRYAVFAIIISMKNCIKKYVCRFLRIHLCIAWLVSYGLTINCFLPSQKLSYIDCLFFRGSSPSEGSEHTINGLHGAGEAHFVFTNVMTKQLAVLAFFIVASADRQQSAWRSYVDNAITLIREDEKVQFMANLMHLMETENRFQDFWRYDGSLTTPPCTEGVICKLDFNYFLQFPQF